MTTHDSVSGVSWVTDRKMYTDFSSSIALSLSLFLSNPFCTLSLLLSFSFWFSWCFLLRWLLSVLPRFSLPMKHIMSGLLFCSFPSWMTFEKRVLCSLQRIPRHEFLFSSWISFWHRLLFYFLCLMQEKIFQVENSNQSVTVRWRSKLQTGMKNEKNVIFQNSTFPSLSGKQKQ